MIFISRNYFYGYTGRRIKFNIEYAVIGKYDLYVYAETRNTNKSQIAVIFETLRVVQRCSVANVQQLVRNNVPWP